MNPIGFTINGNYAYIANYFGGAGSTTPGSYTLCSISSTTGGLTSCSTTSVTSIGMSGTSTPEVITINNNTSNGSVAYVTDQHNDGYSFCHVNSTNGTLYSCTFNTLVQGSGTITPIGPRQMIVYNGYAYFADSGSDGTTQSNSGYTLCSVSSVDGSLSNCSSQQTSILTSGQLNSPTGIAVYNNRMYITNEIGPAGQSTGYSYTLCNIGTAGFLTNCTNLVPQGIINPTESGTYLTYITITN